MVRWLTTNALPRSTSEWHKFPPSTLLVSFPALRSEVHHIRAPDISMVLHPACRYQDSTILWKKDCAATIWSTSSGQCSVLIADTLNDWDDGSDVEGFVDAMLQIAVVVRFSEVDVRGKVCQDDVAKFIEDPSVASQEVDEPAQESGCGIPTSAESM